MNCSFTLAVPGGYTEWTEWQECSVTCGSGIRRRSRNCTNPSPSGGGATCTGGNLGPAEETKECNLPDCGMLLGLLKKKIALYRLVFYYSFSSYKFSSSDQLILQIH